MDIISGFPKVNGLSSIMVVVDRFSKYVIFIAAPTECPSKVVVELFFKIMVKYFGMPKDVISDRDARFTGRFLTYLFNLMATEMSPFEIVLGKQPAQPTTIAQQKTGGKVQLLTVMIDIRVRHRAIVSRYDIPFEVAEKVCEVAYRLKLPERMKIHPTFHVSFLKPYVNDLEDPGRHKTKRGPPEMFTQLEEEIEKILDHRVLGMHKKIGGQNL
ncbi:uncharacterized protein LOC142173432 [Nicotiana tabacum]|uniref:Uncharacterized protein LOC142173432 n=1 Tax=Nicotiana tabacum TaxID=4097 RepID=A0AC58TD21_TOBAC